MDCATLIATKRLFDLHTRENVLPKLVSAVVLAVKRSTASIRIRSVPSTILDWYLLVLHVVILKNFLNFTILTITSILKYVGVRTNIPS